MFKINYNLNFQKIKTKIKSIFALIAICGLFAVVSKPNTKDSGVKSGNAWLAITYVMAENGYSNGATTAVGAIGILDATAWGLGVGMVAGPVGGAVAGAVSAF